MENQKNELLLVPESKALKDSFLSSNSLINKAPLIKPKLDETFPSFLDLSSEVTNPKFSKKGDNSFNKDSMKTSDTFKFNYDQIFRFSTNIKNFFPYHGRALSNEDFYQNQKLNINSNEEEEKNGNQKDVINNINDNESSSSEINIDEYQKKICEQLQTINIEGLEELSKENEQKENKDIKYIDYNIDSIEENEIKNENQEENDEEGYNILFMLKKKKLSGVLHK